MTRDQLKSALAECERKWRDATLKVSQLKQRWESLSKFERELFATVSAEEKELRKEIARLTRELEGAENET